MNKNEFSTYFDIPVETLQQWESGRRNPPKYVISLIKRVIELENEQYSCSFSLEDAIEVAYKNYKENKSMEIVYGDLLYYKNSGKLAKFLTNPSKYPYNFLKELMDMLKY